MVTKTIVKEQIVDDLGEVVRERQEYHVEVNGRFRSITDLQGFNDDEVNVSPSLVDTTNFCDNRLMIDKIMREVPWNSLGLYGDSLLDKDDDMVPEDANFDDLRDFGEEVDPMDATTLTQNLGAEIDSAYKNHQAAAKSENEPTAKRPEGEPKEANTQA